MKTKSILKTTLIAAGFSAFALMGSAKAQTYFDENFDESSFTGFGPAPAGGEYESSQFAPVVGSVLYAYDFGSAVAAPGAGLEAGSTQAYDQNLSSGSHVGFALGVANAPAVGNLQYSFDFQLSGTTINDGQLEENFLNSHVGGTVLDSEVEASGGSVYLQLANGAGSVNSNDLAGAFTDAYKEVYTLNFTSGTYGINVYDLTTGNSLALSESNLALGGQGTAYTVTSGDYISQAYNTVYGNAADSADATFALDNILVEVPVSSPEPTSVALMGLGALALLISLRRRKA